MSTSASPFAHLRSKQRTAKLVESAVWKPDSWESSDTPPPAIKVVWFHESNPRAKRAAMNPRFPQVRRRADGKDDGTKAYEKSKRRMLLLTIVACAVGWENVKDANGADIPFPKIGEEPSDAGVRMLEDLLTALDGEGGVNGEVESFIKFCGDRENFVEYTDNDASEDAPGTRPS